MEGGQCKTADSWASSVYTVQHLMGFCKAPETPTIFSPNNMHTTSTVTVHIMSH